MEPGRGETQELRGIALPRRGTEWCTAQNGAKETADDDEGREVRRSGRARPTRLHRGPVRGVLAVHGRRRIVTRPTTPARTGLRRSLGSVASGTPRSSSRSRTRRLLGPLWAARPTRAVHFIPNGPDRTLVTLHLEFEPEGMVEGRRRLNLVRASGVGPREVQVVHGVSAVTRQVRARRRQRGPAHGTPGVEDAALSRGDSGKAGVSGRPWHAGAQMAGAAVAAKAMNQLGRAPGLG